MIPYVIISIARATGKHINMMRYILYIYLFINGSIMVSVMASCTLDYLLFIVESLI